MISSIETYMKNSAILNAGNTNPTIGTKIEGKNAAAIILYNFVLNFNKNDSFN